MAKATTAKTHSGVQYIEADEWDVMLEQLAVIHDQAIAGDAVCVARYAAARAVLLAPFESGRGERELTTAQ